MLDCSVGLHYLRYCTCVIKMLHICHQDVVHMSSGCCTSVFRMFYVCHQDVVHVSSGCCNVSSGCRTSVFRMMYICHEDVVQVSSGCFTSVIRMLYKCLLLLANSFPSQSTTPCLSYFCPPTHPPAPPLPPPPPPPPRSHPHPQLPSFSSRA